MGNKCSAHSEVKRAEPQPVVPHQPKENSFENFIQGNEGIEEVKVDSSKAAVQGIGIDHLEKQILKRPNDGLTHSLLGQAYFK